MADSNGDLVYILITSRAKLPYDDRSGSWEPDRILGVFSSMQNAQSRAENDAGRSLEWMQDYFLREQDDGEMRAHFDADDGSPVAQYDIRGFHLNGSYQRFPDVAAEADAQWRAYRARVLDAKASYA